MMFGYVNIKTQYSSAEEQISLISEYAQMRGLALERVISGRGFDTVKLNKAVCGDLMVAANVCALGERYADIINNIRVLAGFRLKLVLVKEEIEIDTAAMGDFSSFSLIFLRLNKSILSIKNKRIQDNLLKAGKRRGRPCSGKVGRSKLDEKKEKILEALKSGKTISLIAKELNVGRTTLYMYVKRKKFGAVA